MRSILGAGLLGLTACGSSPISQYCTKIAECATEDCQLSDEACDAERWGEKESCEADLKTRANIIEVGTSPACEKCIESMDQFFSCAAQIETCTDFDEAREEDCDGEFTEYMRDCGPMIEAQCGGQGADSGYDPYWTKGWTPTEYGGEGSVETTDEGGDGYSSEDPTDTGDPYDDYYDDKYGKTSTSSKGEYYDAYYDKYYGKTSTSWEGEYYDDKYGGGSDCTEYSYGDWSSYSCTDYGSDETWRTVYSETYTDKWVYYYYGGS